MKVMIWILMSINCDKDDDRVDQDSLPGLFTADLLSTDILVQGEETIEEDCQAYQGCRQQPPRVESWGVKVKAAD